MKASKGILATILDGALLLLPILFGGVARIEDDDTDADIAKTPGGPDAHWQTADWEFDGPRVDNS